MSDLPTNVPEIIAADPVKLAAFDADIKAHWDRRERGESDRGGYERGADDIMSDKTIEIRGVWLIKEPANLGNHLQVLVELADGTYKVAIADVADEGPISHHVYPAGIAAAPERTFDEETP